MGEELGKKKKKKKEREGSACVAENTGAESKKGLVNRKQNNAGLSFGADRIPTSDGFVNVKPGRPRPQQQPEQESRLEHRKTFSWHTRQLELFLHKCEFHCCVTLKAQFFQVHFSLSAVRQEVQTHKTTHL